MFITSLDPVTGMATMLSLPFIRQALLAGTPIALLSGLAGYFVVLRGQVFAGDMLSHVAYAGALAALAAGIDPRLGLFASTIAVALGIALLAGKGTADDVIIGNAMAWVLGVGVFFLAFYTTYRSTGNSTANVTVLFGSIFGTSPPAPGLPSLSPERSPWPRCGSVSPWPTPSRPCLPPSPSWPSLLPNTPSQLSLPTAAAIANNADPPAVLPPPPPRTRPAPHRKHQPRDRTSTRTNSRPRSFPCAPRSSVSCGLLAYAR
ncbi:MAG: metal ABC transporter permease [Actinobacteria bacterium]|nr:metal ABC transporter permease [Actinomycetota bacterium]